MSTEIRLRQVMATVLECAPEDMTDSASQETIKTWDSLHHVNLIMALEEEFGIEISDDDSDAMNSYPKVRAIIASALGES